MVGRADEQTFALLNKHLEYIKEKFALEKIILFGSRARGDNLIKKQMLEPICYTPEEFEEKKMQIGIVKQAIEEGVEV